MQCHACGSAVTSGDRFCGLCGASLKGVTDATEQLSAIDDPPDVPPIDPPADPPDVPSADPPVDPPIDPPAVTPAEPSGSGVSWDDADPVWAATGQVPVTHGPAGITDSLPATEPVAVDPASADHPLAGVAVVATSSAPAVEPETGRVTVVTTPTAEMPALPTPIREPVRFRPTAVTALAALGAIVALVATFATIVSVSSSTRLIPTSDTPPGFRTGTWIADDLADNLSIAALIAVVALVTGGVAAGFGWRGGSGFAGGAGLAIAGLSALVIGLAQFPIDAAYDMAAIPSEQQFTLTITRDLGYWLQIAAGVIGVVVFFASINDALGDRRPGLNPWIAALGALSGLVFAAGPLVPEGLAVWSDNWYVTEAPGAASSLLLSGRLVQLSLLALTSVIGFLSVRRWGLGIAIGGGLPAIWLVISTAFELTERPAGPGYRNPNFTDAGVHGVTIIGASALAGFSVLALAAAFDQSRRW